MHRNHDFIRRKVSIVADKLKSLIDASAQDHSESDGKLIDVLIDGILAELDDMKLAARIREHCETNTLPMNGNGKEP